MIYSDALPIHGLNIHKHTHAINKRLLLQSSNQHITSAKTQFQHAPDRGHSQSTCLHPWSATWFLQNDTNNNIKQKLANLRVKQINSILRLRIINSRTLVRYMSAFRRDCLIFVYIKSSRTYLKSMQESRRNPKVSLCLRVQHNSVPFSKRRRVNTSIDSNVKNAATHDGHQFAHSRLGVETSNNAEFGEGVIVLEFGEVVWKLFSNQLPQQLLQ